MDSGNRNIAFNLHHGLRCYIASKDSGAYWITFNLPSIFSQYRWIIMKDIAIHLMLSSILLFFCFLFGIGYRDDFADFIVFPSSWSSSDSEIESINSIKTNTNYKKLRNKCQHVTFVISVQILKRRVKVVTGSIHGVLNIQAM